MLFNSLEYLIFFPIVVAAYFAAPQRFRWALLLVASYYFYMAWIPQYILLIVISTLVDYAACRLMESKKTKKERKPYMWASVFVNIGILFTFKYYNWFNENITYIFGEPLLPVHDLLLPIGISFYTLQTMSYTLDVYRGKLKPERHLGVFAVYVSFFPQLVAGPIERAPNLLKQFYEKHEFDVGRVVSGLSLICWGMFKKAVVADRLSYFSKVAYGNPESQPGYVLVIATILFGFQLYCDFSGYSDIAIGSAQVMGFRLMDNFKRPYFSRSIEELWGRRWHISLVSWIKDYIYNPLAFMTRRASTLRKHSNILIVFFVTGLWHGAEWKYVIWGMLNGVFVLMHVLTADIRKRAVEALGLGRVPKIHALLSIAFTFTIFVSGSVFFLAKDTADAIYILSHFASDWSPTVLTDLRGWINANLGIANFALGILAAVVLVGVEIVQEGGGLRERLEKRPAVVRWALSYGIVLWILLFGVFERDQFVYFQF